MSRDSSTSKRRRASIEPCEPRQMMANDPLGLAAASAAANVPNYSFTGLDQERAAYGFDGLGQTVAVIDSGIAFDHPALGAGFGTGYKVVGGWDFATGDARPYDDGPGGGHGTHVAGIIGSTSSKAPGVAAGADLVALRVFDGQGRSTLNQIDLALKWVHAHRNDFRFAITTVNLSIGTDFNGSGTPEWASLENSLAVLKQDGIFISVAAGNSFAKFATPGLSYPAVSTSVVPVAAVDGSGNLASYSQRDQRVLAAPGSTILSTVPDYIGNFNRKTDDYLTMSGTSMAAPFVAGASVLLRQALQFSGVTTINQDTLYDIFRRTADSITDPVTRASYLRINVGHAIESVMPTDDFGSTAAQASAIGNRSSIAGVISRLDDWDYFQFTAQQTGTATLSASGDFGTTARWTQDAGVTLTSSNVLSVAVVAGQTYRIGFHTDRLSHYQIDWNVAGAVNLGVVSSRLLMNQKIEGEQIYLLRAAASGSLVTEIQSSSNVQVEVYNSQRQLQASLTCTPIGNRLQLNVNQQDQLTIVVKGSASQMALRFSTLPSAQFARGIALSSAPFVGPLAPTSVDQLFQRLGQ